MSWQRIKTFLIILFSIINIYLILSTSGVALKFTSDTRVDKATVKSTIDLIQKNYGIKVDKKIVPLQISNLNNIDVTNIIYTDAFSKSKYNFSSVGSWLYAQISTSTYSYNETNAKQEMTQILSDLKINEKYYTATFAKDDSGLICEVTEKISDYPIFNGKITAIFTSAKINIEGYWYIPQTESIKSDNTSLKMTDITSVLVSLSSDLSVRSDASPNAITAIEYGYYVSSYDENTVSKSASAVPCYRIITDDGYKYYYDALNGKTIKQEE